MPQSHIVLRTRREKNSRKLEASMMDDTAEDPNPW
jgi:hypothetical protein